MSLSPQKLAEAKQEAKDLLEYSITVICSVLGVDVSSISGSYTHSVPESDISFSSHESLRKQVENLIALSEV